MIVIPMQHYKALLRHCAVLWPEYHALKNGIVVRKDAGDEIQILCDPERVQLIMNFAGRVYSEAIPHIRQIAELLV